MNAASSAKNRALAPVALLGAGILATCLVPSAAQAAFTVIPQPDAAYVAGTSVIDLSSIPDFTPVTSVSLGTQTISFDQELTKRTVPSSWGSWSSPPESESSTPEVLYNQTALLDIQISEPANTFGFELEPNLFGVFPIKADFYNGASLVGTILQSLEGNAGARLFAATTDSSFTRVLLENTDGLSDGFAIAQIRFGNNSSPVPGPLPLLGAAAAFRTSRCLRKRVKLGARAASH